MDYVTDPIGYIAVLKRRADEAEARLAALELRLQQVEDRERSKAMAYDDGRR